MMDNENKNLQDEQNEKGKKNGNGIDSNFFLRCFIACFVISFFFNLFALSSVSDNNKTQTILTDSFIATLSESTYGSVEEETIFRCVNYTPIFTQDGVKEYDVRFKDMNSDLFFNVVVPASEIDELKNIEKDAQYKAVISYMYVENAFSETTKDLPEDEVDARILALLEGKSEYSKFGIISDIGFMYSNYLEEYTIEKATTYLDEYVDSLVNPPIATETNKVKLPTLGVKSN